MDWRGAEPAQGGVVGVQIRDQLGPGRPVAVQMAEGVARDFMATPDQVADLGGVGKVAHVALLSEKTGADVEGAACFMGLQHPRAGMSRAGGDVVEGEADGRAGQVQAGRAAMRQSGETAPQLALQAEVRGVGLDHIASA
ncbi:hypothetical protein D3C85_1313690 [compost metagenome]